MKLEIGQFRITRADDRNLQLEEMRDVTDPRTKITMQKYMHCGYFSNIELACQTLLTRKIHNSEAQTIHGLLRDIKQTRDEISDVIKSSEAENAFATCVATQPIIKRGRGRPKKEA